MTDPNRLDRLRIALLVSAGVFATSIAATIVAATTVYVRSL